MKVVVQIAKNACVKIDNKVVGKIDNGLMILVGFTAGDSQEQIDFLAKKCLNLRIFPDETGVMNKSVLDVGGSILSVSQFTLYADTNKGNRPSYIHALNGDEAVKLYNLFNEALSKEIHVETGVFGADMEVEFTNMGPTTIIIER